MSDSFVIKRVELFEDFLEIEDLQKTIWGFVETQVVHARLLIEMQKNGGLVLGAFDQTTGKLIAFLLGYLGLENGEVKHCSDMLGVLPEFRSKQLGYQLKLEQRNHVLSQGIRLVTWTFDPLERVNASLNIGRLAAISRIYHQDLFGTNFGSLNAGMPTDRLLVEWWIKSPRVHMRLEQQSSASNLQRDLRENAALINQTKRIGGLSKVISRNLDLSDPVLLLEIPDNIQLIKVTDMDTAMEWRLNIREILERYFAQNYAIVDFFSESHGEYRQSYYVLRHFEDSFQGNELTF